MGICEPDTSAFQPAIYSVHMLIKRAMIITLWMQAALGLLWTYAVLTASNSGWGPLVAFVYTYALQPVFFLFAAWVFCRRRKLRKPAALIMAMPVALLFLPIGIRTLAGGRVEPSVFAAIAVIAAMLAILYGLVRPQSAAKYVPHAWLRSPAFNIGVILLQVLGWLLPVCMFTYLSLQMQSGIGSTDAGMGLAYLLILVVIYFAGLGVTSLLASAIAWVGLRGRIDNTPRKLHIAQLAIATPGVLLGAGAILWIAAQGS